MKTRIDRCDWCGLLLDVNKVLVTPGKFFSAPKSKVRSGSKALFEVIVDSFLNGCYIYIYIYIYACVDAAFKNAKHILNKNAD